MESRIESLWESLRSSSPQRYSYAAEVASDLYSLCIEQITESELGKTWSKTLYYIVQDISSKMARREFSIFIIFSDAYTCSYVA